MKTITLYKTLKFNHKTLCLEYMGERLYKFNVASDYDTYIIEASIQAMKDNLLASDKTAMKEASNHKVVYHDNGVVSLKLDRRDEGNGVKEYNIVSFGKNQVQMI